MSDTMLFKAFCIEQYKLAHHLSGKDTVNLFFRYGVMDYLQSFYDVLHSTGAQYLVEDIDLFLEKHHVQTMESEQK